jgi:beta-phosphoglucomutase
MIKAALFDYDGTLVDSDSAHLACWNAAVGAYGGGIDLAYYTTRCVGHLTGPIAAGLKAEFPGMSVTAEELAREKDARFEEWIRTKTIALLPGVKEMLRFLTEKEVRMGIVTGAPREAIRKTLEDHDLLRFFDPIVTRESVERGKPAPDGYLYALREMGVMASEAAAFEDTRGGVLAARAAGMKAFAIPTIFTRENDFSAADALCTDMFDARCRLSEMMRPVANGGKH